ncbi:1-phosphofructokinase [Chromobacterium violaceum]|uniref:1-phosphofructokinase n=1 Tax=Chromobacterium violaceum TaxID=536 RepID=A0A447TGM0_CHRVL|nr:1-phosphofructokinase [Chromobacterium violaceum]
MGRPPAARPGRRGPLRARLAADGVGRVVVSLGEQGALLVDADAALLASLPPQRPLSTVGAGDALVAGLAAAEARG